MKILSVAYSSHNQALAPFCSTLDPEPSIRNSGSGTLDLELRIWNSGSGTLDLVLWIVSGTLELELWIWNSRFAVLARMFTENLAMRGSTLILSRQTETLDLVLWIESRTLKLEL